MSGKTKEKNQNIQVAVRCRPVNSIERKQGSCSILQCDRVKREVVVKERPGINPYTKTYNFDHVFAPDSEQIDVYKSVVKPVVEEVLTGYNCTIFAYGQTGTGKTFTMEGDRCSDPTTTWQKDPQAGIIPRALHQIFEDLEKQPDVEFSVRVSYLELYNEELYDLLGSSTDPLRLRIYEDNTKKGSVIISGLEEVVVRSKSEVFEIMQRGAAKRQTAATLMNAVSSRSHSVFSVTIHIKENTVDGEELLKTGKLYLVDLAGSENIGRSGAVDKRAREAGNINQSLLTLGRVITALVEHAPHIPYRESKLTRLLQDSLGGRTKTSIIATISPASCNLEETLSTLDYAFRAKNITNRPEVNQKLTKKALLREYNEEIERLRRDLQASREKNGIYVAEENYISMQNKIVQQEGDIQEMEDKITTLTGEMKTLTEMFTDTKEQLADTSEKLTVTSEHLVATTETLKETSAELAVTKVDRDEQQFLVGEHTKNEDVLYSEAEELLSTASTTVTHVGGLHDKIDRKRMVEEHNLSAAQTLGSSVDQQINSLQTFLNNLQTDASEMREEASDQMYKISQQHQEEVNAITKGVDDFLTLVGKEVTEVIKHQKAADKINAGWAVTFEDKFKAMQEKASAFSKEMQQNYSQQISKAQGECQKQRLHMTELASSLLAQKEKTFEALSVCQHELLSKMGVLFDQSCQHITELKARNAHMSAVLQAYATEEEEMEKKMATLRKERKEKYESLLQSACTHFSEENVKADDYTSMLKLTQGDVQQFVDTKIKCIKGQVNDHTASTVADVESAVKTFDAVESFCGSLENQIENTTKQNDQAWVEVMQHVSKSIEQRTAQQGSLSKTQEDMMKKFSDSASLHAANSKSEIDSNCAIFDKLSEDLGTANTTLHSCLSEGLSRQAEGLDTALKTVQEFVTKEIKKDQPTGFTPQRCDYSYPRNLTKTEPHQTLLDRFRASNQQPETEQTSPDTEQNLLSRTPSTASVEDLRGSMSNLSDAGSDKSSHSLASTSGISVCSSTRSKLSDGGGQENRPQRMKPPKTAGVKKTKPAPRTPSKTPTKTSKPVPKLQGETVGNSSRTRLPLRSNNP